MPLVDGVKMSCDVCLRGHRGAVCPHTDRELRPVKPKGRPAKRGKAPGSDTSKSPTIGKRAPNSRSTVGPRKSSCCGSATCRCVHVEGELIESGGCACCGPGLAQQDFSNAASLLHQQVASSPLMTHSPNLSIASPASGSSSSHHTLVKPETPFSSPLPPQSLVAEPFDLGLPCTCEAPCPCPGCPGDHSMVGQRKTSVGDSQKKVSGSLKDGGCCSSGPRMATKVTDEHCQGCLPCIIAPFERSPPAPSIGLASRPEPSSKNSSLGLKPTLPIEAMNRTLPPLAELVPSPRAKMPASISSPGLPYPPLFDDPSRKSSWFRSQMNSTSSGLQDALSLERDHEDAPTLDDCPHRIYLLAMTGPSSPKRVLINTQFSCTS
ncbi:copper-fist-domain-containing protein [Microstroma glucosiphilum]|uniref:Copper-fist-domain-containing protein n=1 Tax=Pseudomicrostroma glucosiphilum TaxID=1684307 RepID=A0A316UIJ9_9BASI|nr:copper-fist-domain-containing protein [Pseudomicrostroma glucosiphilum]PWN23035.1 copper-fist-domain-containing protein [Pseudomicrostroma glucosiphilum]